MHKLFTTFFFRPRSICIVAVLLIACAHNSSSASATATGAPVHLRAISNVKRHVDTAIYGWGYGGVSQAVPIAFQKARVTWAFCGPSCPMYYSEGIKTIAYKNYFRCYASDSKSACYRGVRPGGPYADAAALGNDCRTPEYDAAYRGGYQLDPSKPSAAIIAEAQIGSTAYLNGIMADDTGTTLGLSSYPLCGYNPHAWIAGMNRLNQTLGERLHILVWPNALYPGIVSGATIADQAALAAAGPNVPGAMCEACLVNAEGVVGGAMWIRQENMAIAVTTKYNKIFWAYLNNGAKPDSPRFDALRLYGYASFLLTYAPNNSMLQTAFNARTFSVMPEAGLVPMLPVTTAKFPQTVSAYALPGGGYMREWRQCYYGGTLVAACAVVVNPTPSEISVPAKYSHSLLLKGDDDFTSSCPTTWPTQCLSTNGPAITSLDPGTAAILFP